VDANFITISFLVMCCFDTVPAAPTLPNGGSVEM
jgi:hypothetical protein